MSRLLFFLLSLSIQYTLAQPVKKKITLEDLLINNTFHEKTVSGVRSMEDGIHYTTLTEGNSCIIRYEYKTGEVADTILKRDWLVVQKDTLSIDDYQFSYDENKI